MSICTLSRLPPPARNAPLVMMPDSSQRIALDIGDTRACSRQTADVVCAVICGDCARTTGHSSIGVEASAHRNRIRVLYEWPTTQESAILANTTPLHRVYLGRRPLSIETGGCVGSEQLPWELDGDMPHTVYDCPGSLGQSPVTDSATFFRRRCLYIAASGSRSVSDRVPRGSVSSLLRSQVRRRALVPTSPLALLCQDPRSSSHPATRTSGPATDSIRLLSAAIGCLQP